MSENTASSKATAPRPGGPGGGPGGGGPFGGHGMTAPVAKARDFKASLRRLGRYLAPFRVQIILVVVLAVVSVAFSIIGPKILGNATNLLFEGVIGKQLGTSLPAGLTQAEVAPMLRAADQNEFADMIANMDIVTGRGVDFSAIAGLLGLLAGVYLLSALFGWLQAYIMAGVAQKTIYSIRKEVDEKLARLPLKYFDDHARGDVLSRMTNDIDNISQTLQQTLTQLITAALTIVGVLVEVPVMLMLVRISNKTRHWFPKES